MGQSKRLIHMEINNVEIRQESLSNFFVKKALLLKAGDRCGTVSLTFDKVVYSEGRYT